MKIALMVSGNLGLIVLKDLLTSEDQIVALFTDKGSEAIIKLASDAKIDCFIGKPRGGKAQGFKGSYAPDVLLSINYLFLIEEDLIDWPKKVAINFHGSLLPKYRGRTPHVWAIINNESETGITAHRISLGCDEGDIIMQVSIPIEPKDTGADILSKYNLIYPQLVRDVLTSVKGETVKYTPQDELKATSFGKRTVENGRINWDWQKERIRNWVRAQAYPYPGAFTHLDNKKIIIDQVDFDDFGFHQEQPNGILLTLNPLRVKTPNGVLRLIRVREGLELLTKIEILDNYED